MIVRKLSPVSMAFVSLAFLGLVTAGCSTSVAILPEVQSIKVNQGLVSVRVYPSSTPAKVDGQPIARDTAFPMRPGQVLSISDDAQTCSYTLLKASGDTAEFRQTTSTRQPDGHRQHDTFNVRVIKSVGLTPDEQARLSQ